MIGRVEIIKVANAVNVQSAALHKDVLAEIKSLIMMR